MNTNNMQSIWASGFGSLNGLRREIDQVFDEWWAAPAGKSWRNSEKDWEPACDIEENHEHYLLTLDMPGVPKDHIKLEVVDHQLTISGERRHVHRENKEGVWYSERRQGKFARSFVLPAGVDPEKIEANYQDGILRVSVPKAASAKPRQIKITGGSQTGFLDRWVGQSSTNEKAAS